MTSRERWGCAATTTGWTTRQCGAVPEAGSPPRPPASSRRLRRLAPVGPGTAVRSPGPSINDITVAAALLRIPCSTMFDYGEVLQRGPGRLPPRPGHRRQHDPARAAAPVRRHARTAPLPRLEECFLADFEPTAEVLAELGLDPREPIAVVRTPPAVSLYHRFRTITRPTSCNGCGGRRSSCCHGPTSSAPTC